VLDSFPGMTLGSYQLRPESCGSVRARSPDPFDDPVIQPNYLMHPEDCAVVVAGIKLVRRLLKSPAFARYHDGEVSPGADNTVTTNRLPSPSRTAAPPIT